MSTTANVVPLAGPLPIVGIGRAREIEAHRLPASIAYSLPASVAGALSFRTLAPEYRSAGLPAGMDLVAITITGNVSRADLSSALGVAEQSLKPSGPADSLAATARLRAVARMRQTITDDERLSLVVYAEKLGRYPADAVAMACERWLEASPFWPSVAELLRALENEMQPRRELTLALTRALREAPNA